MNDRKKKEEQKQEPQTSIISTPITIHDADIKVENVTTASEF